MSESTYLCTETGRHFDSEAAARASESRFREIQAECDAGKIPDLRPGDVIYVETSLYVSHGVDDFRGGLGEVVEFGPSLSAGIPVPFVTVAQDPDTWSNWNLLAAEQKKLREQFGKKWSHPDPDLRPEFNRWD
ncbi:MAG: hypothetical protein LAP21_24670 [Acidobacteriia bacterium]|nr:hypothetical protein [Terriglobia bacterium]